MIFRIIRTEKSDIICDSFPEAFKVVKELVPPELAQHLVVNLSRVAQDATITLFGQKVCKIQGETDE